MSRTTWELDSLRAAREAAGLSPPTCDNCVHDCSDRRPGHSPCTGWWGGPGTINDGPTEVEVYEREVARLAGFLLGRNPSRYSDRKEAEQEAHAILRLVRG